MPTGLSRGLGAAVGLALSLTLLGPVGPAATAGTAPAAERNASKPPKNLTPAQRKHFYDKTRLPTKCASKKDLIARKPTRCALNTYDRTRPTLILWGDSHAWSLVPAVKKVARGKDVNLIGYFMGSCPPMFPDREPGQYRGLPCLRNNDMAARFARKLHRADKPVKVILAASWEAYLRALRLQAKGNPNDGYGGPAAPFFAEHTPELFAMLAEEGIDTDVVGQLPIVPRRMKCRTTIPWSCSVPRAKSLRDEERTTTLLRNAVESLGPEAELIDVAGTFCGPNRCRAKVGGTYSWWDYLHITASRARKSAPVFRGAVDDLVQRAEAGS